MTSAGVGRLPAGWTIERVRELSGVPDAVVVDNVRAVTRVAWPPDGEDRPVTPEVVIRLGGLAVVKGVGGEDWYTGHFEDDGGVCCWSAGTLHQMLRGL
ncbi:hypothetical protein [Streptomyces abyssomicinicus]|uniref:hypothetical protein n=1 Tax=Streptomyces abyssomicinicus TaxID=574929 RepID=UPI00124F85CD|nr:hypothetical protein [Streptomyces abyssomicinicus]